MTDQQATGTKTSILHRREELERRDRDLRHAALRAVSAQTRPAYEALQAECAATGHEWKFAHYNWDRTYRWDVCQWCGASEGADDHG
jgi:hypothetical protein